MAPRPYQLGRRAETAERTRQRIVEATADLHAERGLVETTYRDIAERAQVGIGTVYHHFPELGDLFLACGSLVQQRVGIPGPDIFEGLEDTLRIERLVAELFASYERHPSYPKAKYAAATHPVVANMLAGRNKRIRALIRAALPDADRSTVGLIQALTCYEVWEALTETASTTKASRQVAGAISTLVGSVTGEPS